MLHVDQMVLWKLSQGLKILFYVISMNLKQKKTAQFDETNFNFNWARLN